MHNDNGGNRNGTAIGMTLEGEDATDFLATMQAWIEQLKSPCPACKGSGAMAVDSFGKHGICSVCNGSKKETT